MGGSFLGPRMAGARPGGAATKQATREPTMKFSILVNEGPYTHQAADTAYQFTRAALEKGHEIFRVFFYHDGVHNGTRLTVPPQDERNIVKRWSELAEKYALDMVVCIAAAQRRGVLDANEAQRPGR